MTQTITTADLPTCPYCGDTAIILNEDTDLIECDACHKPVAEDSKPEFHIDSEEKACWLLRKLANIEAEKKRIAAQAEAMIADLQADYNRLWFRFGLELEGWAREELAKRGNHRKSLRTFQGTLSFRTVPQTLRVMDAQEAMQYARENAPDCIQTTERLDAGAYKMEAERRLQETGEVLPGVEVQAERESFSVKFGKSEE